MSSDRPLDKTDLRILAILQREGRIPNVELARRVHLSPTPCLQRVKRLEQEGFIQSYGARLDPHALNAGFVAFVTVTLERTTEPVLGAFKERVLAVPEIMECHMLGGGFDYLLKVRVRDMPAFRRLLGETLSALPSVAQTHSHFVMEEVKSTVEIPIPARLSPSAL